MKESLHDNTAPSPSFGCILPLVRLSSRTLRDGTALQRRSAKLAGCDLEGRSLLLRGRRDPTARAVDVGERRLVPAALRRLGEALAFLGFGGIGRLLRCGALSADVERGRE